MPVLVVGGIKGGTGKTTIATNLTVLRSSSGKKVLLVDADEQRSAITWTNHRIALGIETPWTTIQLSGKAVHSEVQKLKKDFDDIIIDTGGRETTSLRASLVVADKVIFPLKPRSFDIWTLADLARTLSEMKVANTTLLAYAVLNQADSRGEDNEDALAILEEQQGIECIKSTIGSRKAFANAASDGKSVVELKKIDQKAVDEICELYCFLYKDLISAQLCSKYTYPKNIRERYAINT